MAIRTKAATNVDEYIAESRSEVKPILRKIRRTIRTAAPGAQELISYRMPAFRLHGILVYFAWQYDLALYAWRLPVTYGNNPVLSPVG